MPHGSKLHISPNYHLLAAQQQPYKKACLYYRKKKKKKKVGEFSVKDLKNQENGPLAETWQDKTTKQQKNNKKSKRTRQKNKRGVCWGWGWENHHGGDDGFKPVFTGKLYRRHKVWVVLQGGQWCPPALLLRPREWLWPCLHQRLFLVTVFAHTGWFKGATRGDQHYPHKADYV